MPRASLCSRALSIDSAARRPSSSATARSAVEYGRREPVRMRVIAPSVRRRTVSGTTMALRRSSSRDNRRCSASRAPATSISSVIVSYSSLTPVRTTFGAPVTASGSGG